MLVCHKDRWSGRVKRGARLACERKETGVDITDIRGRGETGRRDRFRTY